eukprot:GHVN01078240.1.p1 GENE.GHVN01078240.1~~GHVN01078240.1.p1  ORF type:complete len:406 (-),score=-3.75 GHVN01078240.1:31-1077(-)
MLLALVGVATIYSFHLLIFCAKKTQKDGNSSFYSVMNSIFPGYGFIPEIFIIIKCIGVATSYLGLLGDTTRSLPFAQALPEIFRHRFVWIALMAISVAPFTYFKKIDSLKVTSSIGLFSVAYLTFILAYDLYINGMEETPSSFIWDLKGLFGLIPSIVFAFGCQQNLFPVYNEARNKETSGIGLVGALSVSISFVTYTLVGVLGYLRYGSHLRKDVLMNLSENSILLSLVKYFYIILVFFSYPFQILPARESLCKIMPGTGRWSERSQRIALTTALLSISLLFAFLFPDMTASQKLIGSVVTPTIGYIIPGVMYLRLKRSEMQISLGGLALFFLGFFLMGLSLVSMCL